MEEAAGTPHIRSGSYVQLKQNINCIPKGVYRVADVSPGLIELRVGKSFTVLIWGCPPELVTAVNQSQGLLMATRPEQFESAYNRLISESDDDGSFDPNKPVTMCIKIMRPVCG